jgi:hypothetical protein
MDAKPKCVDFICVVQEACGYEIHPLNITTIFKVHTDGLQYISKLVIPNTCLFKELYLWKSPWQVVVDLSFICFGYLIAL